MKLIDSLMELPNLDVVVIDDDSPDGTWKLVENYPEYQRRVYLIRRMGKKGRGLAGVAGFKYALERRNKYDCVVEMDADFSHSPDEIMKLVENLNDSDLVLGSRFIQESRDINRSLERRILSSLSNLYVRIMTGMRFCDPNSGFKAYTMNALDKIGIDKLTSVNYSVTQEILYRAVKKGLKIKEIPVKFFNRMYGKSKVSFYIIIETFFFMIRLRLRRFSKDL